MGLYGTDDAEETQGVRENFIGRVVDSAVDADTGGSDEFESDIDLLYEIEVLDRDWKNQQEYSLSTSQQPGSKWIVFAHFFEQTFGSFEENGISSLDDLTTFLKGKVLEFRDIVFTEQDVEIEWGPEGARKEQTLYNLFKDMENKPNRMMVPVREVPDDEAAALGGSGDSKVEEVEFEE